VGQAIQLGGNPLPMFSPLLKLAIHDFLDLDALHG
jgi:hypothetical protein